MTTFVLVHGAFRGGWAWNPVRERLTALGHDVRTPSLTGMGDRRHLVPATGDSIIRLDTWITDISSLLEGDDLRDVVLVGHSLGGFVTTAAASVVHERLARLVLLDAPVPDDGERAIDHNPAGVPIPSADQVDLSMGIPARPVSPDEGFGDELAAWINERLCPTPFGPSFDPARVSVEAAQVPRTYVFFARTPATYPCGVTRARMDAAGEPYVLIDAGHDAMLTDPDAVAELLDGLAGK